MKKLSYLAKQLWIYNHYYFGNRYNKLLPLQKQIIDMEKVSESRDLITEESRIMGELVTEQWVVSRHEEAIWRKKSRQN